MSIRQRATNLSLRRRGVEAAGKQFAEPGAQQVLRVQPPLTFHQRNEDSEMHHALRRVRAIAIGPQVSGAAEPAPALGALSRSARARSACSIQLTYGTKMGRGPGRLFEVRGRFADQVAGEPRSTVRHVARSVFHCVLSLHRRSPAHIIRTQSIKPKDAKANFSPSLRRPYGHQLDVWRVATRLGVMRVLTPAESPFR